MARVEPEPGAAQRQSTTEEAQDAGQADDHVRITAHRALTALARGSVRERGLLPYSSNHSFLVVVSDGALALPAVYKPQRGESPLWDFPWGTLCKRERAAWLTSHILGWELIPPTVLRSASRGLGSVQFYVDHEEEAHYFTVQQDARFADAFRRLALFDSITNNADRKSGHCLVGRDGRLWAIDHGLCFHSEYKLRTVIWEFAGERIEVALQDDLRHLLHELEQVSPLFAPTGENNGNRDPVVEYDSHNDAAGDAGFGGDPIEDRTDEVRTAAQEICSLLNDAEQRALLVRIRTLLRSGCYPAPDPQRRNYPWPPV